VSRSVKETLRPSPALLLCLLTVIGATGPVHGASPTPPAGNSPAVRSAAALVIDRATGSVIYERRADASAPIASITKLMTALVIVEARQPLNEEIQITAEDRTRTQGLASRLAVGTRLTREELLRLALMSSENRAAQALCRSYTGGERACLAAMNAKAKQLGMTGAHFDDGTGLSPRNVASPNDLAKLVIAANHVELIREFSTTPAWSARVGRQVLEFHNTDPLVRDPEWQVSVQKTGHIAAAGQCLVLQALIGGRDVVIVLLNSVGKYTRVADARRVRAWMGTLEKAVAKAGENLAGS
jgi:serine-type D-Ala-D-Ala endopeptidase (penicillin-binding protein 7)